MEFFEPPYLGGKDFNTIFQKLHLVDQTQVMILVCDALVLRAGRPYYKVWPEYVDVFMKTRLDAVPVSQLRFPFPAIEIRLSKPIVWPGAHREILAIQVALFSSNDLPTLRVDKQPCDINDALGIVIGIRERVRNEYASLSYVIRVSQEMIDMSVEQLVTFATDLVNRQGYESDEALSDEFSSPRGDEVYHQLIGVFRLIVSTVFIATGQYRFVNPDVLNADIGKLLAAISSDDQATIDKLADRATRRRQGSRGFTVGKFHTIDVPNRPSGHGSEVESDASRELRYQHMRSAHLRVQWVGPGRTQQKVVFIAPVIVRPDLPVSSSVQERCVR